MASRLPCRYFPLGTCRFGAGCRFSHDTRQERESQNHAAQLPPTKPTLYKCTLEGCFSTFDSPQALDNHVRVSTSWRHCAARLGMPPGISRADYYAEATRRNEEEKKRRRALPQYAPLIAKLDEIKRRTGIVYVLFDNIEEEQVRKMIERDRQAERRKREGPPKLLECPVCKATFRARSLLRLYEHAASHECSLDDVDGDEYGEFFAHVVESHTTTDYHFGSNPWGPGGKRYYDASSDEDEVTHTDDVAARLGASAALVAGLMTLVSGACLDLSQVPPGGWPLRFNEALLLPTAAAYADRLRSIAEGGAPPPGGAGTAHWLHEALEESDYPEEWLSGLFEACDLPPLRPAEEEEEEEEDDGYDTAPVGEAEEGLRRDDAVCEEGAGGAAESGTSQSENASATADQDPASLSAPAGTTASGGAMDRSCRGIAASTGQRCRRRAASGRDFCHAHGPSSN